MPKKSKPKQRTNWKQRALLADERCVGYSERLAEIHRELDKAKERATHCEHVIEVQNQVAKAAEVRMSRYIYSGAEALKRAESAEKHNALLLEERENRHPYQPIVFGDSGERHHPDPNHILKSTRCPGCHKFTCRGECMVNVATPMETTPEPENPQRRPTHWQRFKSYFMAGLRGE